MQVPKAYKLEGTVACKTSPGWSLSCDSNKHIGCLKQNCKEAETEILQLGRCGKEESSKLILELVKCIKIWGGG